MKNKQDEYDSFFTLMDLSLTNTRKLSYRIKSNKLDLNQKIILKSFLVYKRGEFQKVLQELDRNFSSDFLNAIRDYLKAQCLNHTGKLNFALEHFSKAASIFQKLNCKRGLFECTTSMFYAYANRREIQGMRKSLEQLEVLSEYRAANLSLYYSMQSLYSLITENPKECIRNIALAMDCSDNSKHLLSGLLIIKFGALFQEEHYEQCYQTLEKYKSLGGFSIPLNYRYMHTMLNHLLHNSPIYIYNYKNDFQGAMELYDQLMCIKSLSEALLEDAKLYWNKLQKHNPHLYNNGFQYKGETSLFSRVLEKNLPHTTQDVKSIDLNKLVHIGKPILKLKYILQNSSQSVCKYELYKMIYGQQADPNDLVKLRKLISKLRSEIKEEILVKNGNYFIKKTA